MQVELDLHQLVRNRFGYSTLIVDWPHRRQIPGSSFLSQWNRFGLRYSTLAVEWPHRRHASWDRFDLQYLGCGLATHETGGSFLSQLEPVLLTVPWLWTGHIGES
jgi:hypothetical protein